MKYIASLDVGTTTVRCQIFNSNAELVAAASTLVELVYPEPGYVEIDPKVLWDSILKIINQAIYDSKIPACDINCMGIGTQRATFITWNKETGEPYHNFITWKDLRSKELVDEWNNSISMRMLRKCSYLIHLVTRSKRFLAGSSITLTSTQATLRLLWVLQNIPELKRDVERNLVMYGTVETWLVYKLTGGKTYITDITNASTTGIYDPFIMDWSSWVFSIIGLPRNILPPVVPTDYKFGSTELSLFGVEIPITCVMADQQASLFGSCCYKSADILKVTLGTGSFLDINTGNNAHGSCQGIYPVVAWQTKDEIVYMAEGACNDTGSLIQWALRIGLTDNPSKTSDLANSVTNSNGLYFIPAFSGLGPPITDDKAASGFLGVKPTTTNAHMIRAILESIVFRIIMQFDTIKRETNGDFRKIYVDGGVSQNNFVCQLLSDMTNLQVERPSSTEMSVLGITFVAGLNSGIWANKEELINFRKVDRIFNPSKNSEVKKIYENELNRWIKVTKRFGQWHS